MTRLFTLNSTASMDPAIAEWWDTRAPELSAVAKHWFGVMHQCGDDVLEVLHDDMPTACVGEYAFAYVNVFTAHVNVGFFQGASLPDPDSLLEGDGKNMRHVKIRPGKFDENDALETLIRVACDDMRQRIEAGE